METIILVLVGAAVLAVFLALAFWRRVPIDMVDVVSGRGNAVKSYSGNVVNATTGQSGYFKIPSWVPYLGMEVNSVPLNIMEIGIGGLQTFDVDRVRFLADIACYVTVAGREGAIVAATRFQEGNLKEQLERQLRPVIQEAVRDTTTKMTIHETINNRDKITVISAKAVEVALKEWGLSLKKLSLVNLRDLEDGEATVIEDISKIREVEINSEARQKNALRTKEARMKEAEADQEARNKEIERDKQVGMWEKQRDLEVYKRSQLAKEEEMRVTKIQTVRQAEINKEKQIIDAEARKQQVVIEANAEKAKRETEAQGFKAQKTLEGEGEGKKREMEGKGEAEAIRAKGFAEAEAKEKLQAALNKFQNLGVTAMVAEKIVAMQRDVGIASAEALKNAELKIFAGSEGKSGFDLGQMVSAMSVSNESLVNSVLNRMARPNDLGFGVPVESVKKKG